MLPIAFAGLAASIAANDLADAASLRNEQSVSRPAGEPIMAIVSLRDQVITVARGQFYRSSNVWLVEYSAELFDESGGGRQIGEAPAIIGSSTLPGGDTSVSRLNVS